jgi:HSP20 family protein
VEGASFRRFPRHGSTAGVTTRQDEQSATLIAGGFVMARTSLTPFRPGSLMGSDPFFALPPEASRFFEEFFRGRMPMVGGEGQESGLLMPQMNLSETDNEVRITAELPGVADKDVDVTLDDDVLTIRGEKKMEKKEDKENYHVIERSFGRFQRSFRIPHSVNADQVQAHVDKGVLTVILPKNQAQEKTRRIQVKPSAR